MQLNKIDTVDTDISSDASEKSTDIAIIGMAGRFPGARNIEEFWANLISGKESIRRLTDEQLLHAGVPRRDIENPDYVKVCPVLDDIDKFDAAFFKLSPRDASVMDPAHRFFLEVAWEALENSGNTGLNEEGRVGVFASSGAPLYWMNNVRTHREIMESMGEFLVRHTSNDMNFLATRASYDLDLRGPSINVQTACSSALVAAHLARQSLLAGECDMALIGGSTINNPMGHGYHYKEGEILSPDGHCRPFDHRSAGTVFGSGTGCLVLKRLDDALDNGDTIHAIIKGSAINNDGSMKVGFLAPGVEGQVDVIKDALGTAQVNARSISYIEAHGTGTSVGDPIELTALEQAFSEQTKDKQFCGIGSVKSNIGHLGEAAAAASLIKVVLALKHRMLPPSLGYERPNPRFDMEDSPFYVNATLKAWESSQPLRAGITALGAGGTNCHLILEEPPAMLPGEGGRDRQLIVLSAKSKTALEQMSSNLATHLEKNPEVDLGDVAYTLAMGRRALSHRRVLVASDHAEAIGLLRGENPTRVSTTAADSSDPGVVYTFPGGGAQYSRMCFDLYETEPVYRGALDECFDIIECELNKGLRSLLFSAENEAEAATEKLQQPSFALPTLFAVEYALARLFESYGVRPAAYIGHSMGEYVAACLAGVFSLRDGLRLVHLRGRLFESTQKGNMIGVSLSEQETRSLMPQGLSIAAVNAPELCVASGPSQLIENFSQTLTGKEIDWTPIHIDVAAHSSLLDPILDEFRKFCRSIEFHPPLIPIASNLTGRWLSAAEATDPEYWVKHLRNTVRFTDCVETVLEGGNRVFLEIGPGRTLTTLVGAQKTKARHSVNSVRHPKEAANDVDYALLTLGKVWAAGAHIDWTALYDDQIRNRVPLPNYPFEGQSYWVEPKAVRIDDATEPVKRENLDEWFSTVAWEQTPLVAATKIPVKHWLIFARDIEFGRALSAEIVRLSLEPCEIVFAKLGAQTSAATGSRLRQLDELHYEIPSGSIEQYQSLLEHLKADGRAPEHVVLLSGASATQVSQAQEGFTSKIRRFLGNSASQHSSATIDVKAFDERLEMAYFTPVHLCQAISTTLDTAAFTLVTENAFSVRGESVDPWARLSLGPSQVIPRELPEFPTRLIDLDSSNTSNQSTSSSVQQLARELLSSDTSSPVALRAPSRWTQHLRSTQLPAPEANTDWLEDGSVVLITGGLGGIGLVLAEHLARKKKIRLALLSRDGLPPRATWNETASPQLKRRIDLVKGLEALGAQVLIARGDVTDRASLDNALTEIRTQLGPIDIVIHAAGIMDDEPLQTKTDAKMRRVLAPKVQGTMNLDALITEDLKAFVLMSSIASFLGLPGQIDYTAANAFLDAFAEDRQKRKAGRTLVINWNAWRDVGMIVDVERHASEETPPALPPGRTQHPWLDAVEETANGRRYFTDFSVASHWLLSEHQIEGADALIPGTGFVELARAACVDAASQLANSTQPETLELCQVTFLSPFRVGEQQQRRLQIDVERQGDTFAVSLRSANGQETHMTAEARRCGTERKSINLQELRGRCLKIEPTRNGFLDQDFVRFGPRWQNIEEIRIGNREAILQLKLPEAFVGDLGRLAYHPALLDMATGAAQMLIPGFRKESDFLVPFGYDNIRMLAPVGQRITSHIKLRPESSTNIAAFDISLFDESGFELIVINGFTMKRVDGKTDITQRISGRSTHESKPNPVMEALLREAITKAEGVIAFDRALAQTEMTQIVASSVDVNIWLRKLELDAKRLLIGADNEEGSTNFSRPALASDYVKPETALEIALATMWSKLLGVDDIGVLDDFFELGGNSLIAVRFFARVKKDLGVSLPLSTLFQAPTIRSLGEVMHAQGYVDKSPAATTNVKLVVVNASTSNSPKNGNLDTVELSKNIAPLLIRPGTGRPPLFFVHDGLGEVLLYRNLALRLNQEHPVYGLEPEMSNGRFTHTRIVDMARAKVERIRTIQPKGPYLIAGLCAGGVIAFEIAQQLQDAGEQTHFVGIIDAADVAAQERRFRVLRERLARVLSTLRPSANEPALLHISSVISTLANKVANLVSYTVSSRLERARNAKKVAALRSQGTQPTTKTTEIDFIKLYELAHQEHIPQGKFRGGDIVLFRATENKGIDGDKPFREVYADPLLGWQQRVEEPVIAIDVPGGHSSALQEPHVEALAREMQIYINSALERHKQLNCENIAQNVRRSQLQNHGAGSQYL